MQLDAATNVRSARFRSLDLANGIQVLTVDERLMYIPAHQLPKPKLIFTSGSVTVKDDASWDLKTPKMAGTSDKMPVIPVLNFSTPFVLLPQVRIMGPPPKVQRGGRGGHNQQNNSDLVDKIRQFAGQLVGNSRGEEVPSEMI